MCTVSWLHESDGYQLLCNRDEKLSRIPAVAPRVHERDGVRYVAPMDGNFGGAWIGTNEFGISVCLLNGTGGHYSPRTTGARSRGLLVPELLVASSIAEVETILSHADLAPYAPFTLAVLEPGQFTSVMEWDGADLAIVPYGEPYMPLVSSSFDPEGVQARRHSEFARRLRSAGKLDAGLLFEFHGSHGRQADAYAPCMHRDDARTVSFTWVRVSGNRAEYFYTPEAPCSWSPGESQLLELRH